MPVSYTDLTQMVDTWYTDYPDIWAISTEGGVTQGFIETISAVPEASITYTDAGTIMGYSYDMQLPAVQSAGELINSNVQTGQYGLQSVTAEIPATATADAQTGLITMESGVKSVSTGSTIMAIADKASLALTGIALGTKLGKIIDENIYNIAPDWFDEHFPYINPQTWPDMCTTENGKSWIRAIFGIEDDKTTMYMDTRMLAYTYAMFLGNGAYDTASRKVEEAPAGFPDLTAYVTYPFSVGRIEWYGTTSDPTIRTHVTYTSDENVIFYKDVSSSGTVGLRHIAYKPVVDGVIPSGSIHYHRHTENFNTVTGEITTADYDGTYSVSTSATNRYTFNNQTVAINPGSDGSSLQYADNFIGNDFTGIPDNDRAKVAWLALYNYIETQALPGVTDNPDSSIIVDPNTVINPSTGEPVTAADDIDDILQALQTAYPDLFDGAVTEDVLQDDGTLKQYTYVPVPYPNTENAEQPVTYAESGLDPQVDYALDPAVYPESILESFAQTVTQPDTNGPETGGGNSPAVVIPTGSVNALFTVYNPTQAQLNQFGAWLWSPNFIDQLLKLFNDPMQSIIGLHKIYATPTINGNSTIHVGYLDSNVPSAVVGAQYVTVDCGTVALNEYFGNVFDYDPFTSIYLYLPFIGIVRLDTGDVMRGRINIIYHVDVLTGACLAEVNVIRDNAGGTIYTYTGNAAVQYPISSGSYMGIVASLASVVGGVVGTIATGGALAPVALGAVSGVLNAHTRVEHSGGFSGNAGAMGNKKPYLIITRPQTAMSSLFPGFNGYTANASVPLYTCHGYTKCEVVHTDGIQATAEELDEIDAMLKQGVII